jgi:hypothetical protein
MGCSKLQSLHYMYVIPKASPMAHGFDAFLVQSVKTAMQIPFDNLFADWKTDQIRVPMNPALTASLNLTITLYHKYIKSLIYSWLYPSVIPFRKFR